MAVKEFFHYCLLIVGTGFGGALLGGAFGAVVALISAEFVISLFLLGEEDQVLRYAWAVGMIWGLFLGLAVGAFSALLVALPRILRTLKTSA